MATPPGLSSIQERISAKFGKADLTVVLPDALCIPSGWSLGISS
jgi:invasion protein IalB